MAAYASCLADLARLAGVDPSPAESGTREWRGATRVAIWRVVRRRHDLPDELFEALVRDGVYEPDPSFCCYSSSPP